MCVKFPPENLNPDSYPHTSQIHFTNTNIYICEMTIVPKEHDNFKF